MIDILKLEPHVVSSDITGYSIGIMGPPGCGKTTLASKIPNALLIATEPGYKAIPGIIAQDVNNWVDFLQVVSQLRKPEAKERFKVIVIDTLDELVFLATQYLLKKENVSDISDIGWGKGYNMLEELLRKVFRQIQESYGLILLAHDGRKSEKDENDKDTFYASLNFNRKVKRVVMGLLDILAYVETKRGDASSIMHFRDSEHWEAKSRFANIVDSCPFSYEDLAKAIQDAVSQDNPTSERQVVHYSEENMAAISQFEFEKYLIDLNELAMKTILEKGKESEVKDLINLTLNGRKLSQAKIEDYIALVGLEENIRAL